MTSIRNRLASVYQTLGGRKKSTIEKHGPPQGLARLNTLHSPTAGDKTAPVNDVHDKPWGNDLRHKFDVVSEQVDRGLMSLSAAVVYLEKLLSYATANDPTKLTKRKEDEKDNKDEMHSFGEAIDLFQSALFTHITAEHALMLAVRAKVLEPLQACHKESSRLKKEIDKQGWGKLEGKRAASKANLEKVGQDAWLVIHAQNAIHKDLVEGVGDNAKDRAKLTQTFKSQQERTLKSVTVYQKEWETVNTLEVEMEKIEDAIAELQAIERNRLLVVQNSMKNFHAIVKQRLTNIQKTEETVRTKSDALDPKAQLDNVLDGWVRAYGPPPAYNATRYGLPIHLEDVMAATGEIPTVLEDEEDPEHKDTPKGHSASQSGPGKSTSQVCEECDDDKREVSVRCDDCDQWLCKQCSNKLHSKGTRVGHKYHTLERKSAAASIASSAAIADLANSIPPLTPSHISVSTLSTSPDKGSMTPPPSSPGVPPSSPPRKNPLRNAVATPFAAALNARLGADKEKDKDKTERDKDTVSVASAAVAAPAAASPPEAAESPSSKAKPRREKPKACDECDGDDEIVVFCPECDEYMCKKCSGKVHAKGLRASHPVENLAGGSDTKKRTSSQDSDGQRKSQSETPGGSKKRGSASEPHESSTAVDPMFRILSKHQTQTKLSAATQGTAIIESNKKTFVDPSEMAPAEVCDDCKDSERPVVVRCNECDKWFCRKCNMKTHQTGGLKENHEYSSLKPKVMSPN